MKPPFFEKMRRGGEVLSRNRLLGVAVGGVAVAGLLDAVRLWRQENYPLSAQSGQKPPKDLIFTNPQSQVSLNVPKTSIDEISIDVDYKDPKSRKLYSTGQTVIFTEINALPSGTTEINAETLNIIMPLGFAATLYEPPKNRFGPKWAKNACAKDVQAAREICETTAAQLAAQSGRPVRLIVPESQGLGNSSVPTLRQTALGYFGRYDNMLQTQLDAMHLEYGPEFEDNEIFFLGYSRAGRMAAHMAELTAKKYGKENVLGFASIDPAGTVTRNWALSLSKLLKDGPTRQYYNPEFEELPSWRELVIGYQTFGVKGLLSLVESMGLNNPGFLATVKKLGKLGIAGTVACIDGSTVTPPKGHKKVNKRVGRSTIKHLVTGPNTYHTHAALYHEDMPAIMAAMVMNTLSMGTLEKIDNVMDAI